MSVQIPLFEKHDTKASKISATVEELAGEGFDMKKFVDNFHVLADADGGIEHVRGLIIDLAIRGRLGTQNSSDASATGLVQRARAALGSGRRRRTIDLPPPTLELPSNWTWCEPQDLGEISPRNDAVDELPVGFVPMTLVPIDYRRPVVAETRQWKDIKKGYTHLANLDIAVAKITPCFQNGKSCVMAGLPNGLGAGTTELLVLRPVPGIVEPQYLLLFFKSPDFIVRGTSLMTGTAGQQRVPVEYFAAVPLPLPPLAEQKRIVAKVDQLMALCDELEARQTKKRALGTCLTKSALEALTNAEGPADFDAAWKRAVENFDILVDRAEKVEELRMAILSLALRGRLCRAIDGDPLSELRATRARELVPEGERPHAVPKHWAWLYLDQVVGSIADGDHQPPPKAAAGVPFLTIGNVSSGRLDFSETRFVRRDYYDDIDARRVPAQGDILYTVVGATYGRPVRVDTKREFCVQRHIAILRPDGSCDPNYLYLFLRSRDAYKQATAAITGTAQPTVPLRPLRRFRVPLPPRAEQTAIVTKVERLMKVCDELDATLRRVEQCSSALAEAVTLRFVG